MTRDDPNANPRIAAPDELNALLDRAARGELDAFTPEQIAQLEAHLNSDSSAERRLMAAAPPRVHPVLQLQVPPVSPATWKRVWSGIESSAAAQQRRSGSTRRLKLHRWLVPLTAAAACIALVLFLRIGSSPAFVAQPAENSTIESLEVFGNETPFVVSTGGEHAASVIWVLDEQGA